jgi:hypothetical protein
MVQWLDMCFRSRHCRQLHRVIGDDVTALLAVFLAQLLDPIRIVVMILIALFAMVILNAIARWVIVVVGAIAVTATLEVMLHGGDIPMVRDPMLLTGFLACLLIGTITLTVSLLLSRGLTGVAKPATHTGPVLTATPLRRFLLLTAVVAIVAGQWYSWQGSTYFRPTSTILWGLLMALLVWAAVAVCALAVKWVVGANVRADRLP